MTADPYSRRRHTDRGYIAPFPTTLSVLRRVLGLVPVTESLGALGHWRRGKSTSQAETAGSVFSTEVGPGEPRWA